MSSSWLLVMIFVVNGYGTAKYIEFPNKALCEAASLALKEKTRTDSVCVAGGRPIPEASGVAESQG